MKLKDTLKSQKPDNGLGGNDMKFKSSNTLAVVLPTLAVIAAGVIGYFNDANQTEILEKRFDRIEDRADKRSVKVDENFAKVYEEFDKVYERLDRIEDKADKRSVKVDADIAYLRSLTDRVIGHLSDTPEKALSGVSAQDTAANNSPLQLTKRGKEIAKEIGAAKIVDKYYAQIPIPDDADALAIQRACYRFAYFDLLDVVDKQEKRAVRDAIYQENSGAREILIIFGIMFRNKVLQLRGLE